MNRPIILLFCLLFSCTQKIYAQQRVDTLHRNGVSVYETAGQTYGVTFHKQINTHQKNRWMRVSFQTAIAFENRMQERDTASYEYLYSSNNTAFSYGYEISRNLGNGFHSAYGADQLIFVNQYAFRFTPSNSDAFNIRDIVTSMATKPFLAFNYRFRKQFFISLESSMQLRLNFESLVESSGQQFFRKITRRLTIDSFPTNLLRFGIYF